MASGPQRGELWYIRPRLYDVKCRPGSSWLFLRASDAVRQTLLWRRGWKQGDGDGVRGGVVCGVGVAEEGWEGGWELCLRCTILYRDDGLLLSKASVVLNI